MNPVILLDEVDKLGADFRGDPSSALLEVLDPAQNHTFRDHYLEVDLDLSKVLFVATANVVDTIPGPAARPDGGHPRSTATPRPRRSPSPGTTWCGRQLERAAPAPRRGRADRRRPRARSSADYTREAGVRSLERELGRLLRKVATKLAAGRAPRPGGRRTPTTSGAGWAGPRFFFEAADRTSVPGVVTGLAVTGAGGDVLFVEATVVRRPRGPDPHRPAGRRHEGVGRDRPLLRALARRRAGHRPGAFAGRRFHVHVPAGAVPKDGPSAGVTMTTALVSLLRGRAGAPGGGDDRRGHPAGPGAARSAGSSRRCWPPTGPASPRWCCRPATAPTSRTCPRRSAGPMTFHLAADGRRRPGPAGPRAAAAMAAAA